jgi:hypothetical protein
VLEISLNCFWFSSQPTDTFDSSLFTTPSPFSPQKEVVTKDEKIAATAVRRNTMMTNDMLNMQRMAALWQEKLAVFQASQEQVDLASKRKQKWILIVTAVNKMAILGNMVKHIRFTRGKDVRK